MFITIKDGKAKFSEQGMNLPVVKKLYVKDKTSGKKSFDMWGRFIYYVHDKESIYRNYLPKEREKQVVDSMFPDKSVSYFKGIAGLQAVIDTYVEMGLTFKELLYQRLLSDVEAMLDKVSRIELTKTARVQGARDVTFYSERLKEEITEKIDLNVRVTLDNSEEKIKAMDTLDKLLKREVILKNALREEQVAADLKKASDKRMFDN